MRGATCFSGIGAPELGMPQYDWIWHAEIEPFPAAVLAARFGAGRPVFMPDPEAEGLDDHRRRERAAAIRALERVEWGAKSTNLGDVLHPDFIERAKALGPLDIMAGGPPCQAFSLAGLRGSMGDPRGNLSLRWVQILHAVQPRNAITENVPGWLSTEDNAFGCFLAGLVGADDPLPPPIEQRRWPDEGMVEGPRARAAWRILDAQHFGLAQRRRRVFVVADFGDGADPAQILFERQGLHGNPPPRREAGERSAPTLAERTRGGGGLGTDAELDGALIAQGFGGGNCSGPIDAAACLTTKNQRIDFEAETFIAHTLRAEGFDASEDGTGRGTPLVPVAIQERAVCENPDAGPDGIGCRQDGLTYTLEARTVPQAVAFSSVDYGGDAGDIAPTLRSGHHDKSHQNGGAAPAVAFDLRGREGGAQFEGPHDSANIRSSSGGSSRSYVAATAVRRLTPTECARLQGFPDDHCHIQWNGKAAPDGLIYRAYGNSWAVKVGAWIGERIARSQQLRKAA
ncbi:MAG TPA: DNA cytosine methyltransferase [Allosphingosinicella sp.]|jgi:DNA (cytosine-5)-methyltransferase 1